VGLAVAAWIVEVALHDDPGAGVACTPHDTCEGLVARTRSDPVP